MGLCASVDVAQQPVVKSAPPSAALREAHEKASEKARQSQAHQPASAPAQPAHPPPRQQPRTDVHNHLPPSPTAASSAPPVLTPEQKLENEYHVKHLMTRPIIKRSNVLRMGTTSFKVGAVEVQGWRNTMEDAYAINMKLDKAENSVGFFGVFDGHTGDRASQFCKTHLPEAFRKVSNPLDQTVITKIFCDVDAEFCKNKAAREDGSTAVCALIEWKPQLRAVIANVGDSKCLHIKSTGEVFELTRDAKPHISEETNRIKAAGGKIARNRVEGLLSMSRAMGDYQFKNNSKLAQDKQKVIPVPEYRSTNISARDMIFLSSDGAFEELSVKQIGQLLHDGYYAQPHDKKDPAKLLALLFEKSIGSESRDNHSGVLILFENGERYSNDGYEDLTDDSLSLLEQRQVSLSVSGQGAQHGVAYRERASIWNDARDRDGTAAAAGGGGGGGGAAAGQGDKSGVAYQDRFSMLGDPRAAAPSTSPASSPRAASPSKPTPTPAPSTTAQSPPGGAAAAAKRPTVNNGGPPTSPPPRTAAAPAGPAAKAGVAGGASSVGKRAMSVSSGQAAAASAAPDTQCAHCRSPLKAGARFCNECGKVVNRSNTVAGSPPGGGGGGGGWQEPRDRVRANTQFRSDAHESETAKDSDLFDAMRSKSVRDRASVWNKDT